MNDEARNLALIKEYSNRFDSYVTFTQMCHNIIKNYIDESGANVHSITSRTKEITSFWSKLLKKAGEYKKLDDCTDLSGIRVITYFSADVDTIGSIIESNFNIDFEKSIDKRKMLAPDRFGYLSLHYVVKLSHERLRTAVYGNYADFQFEIQIRSLLQHCWAEIEHTYGYKTEKAIPSEITRRFSQLAGLLEIADDGFLGIREEVQKSGDISQFMESNPDNVFIDMHSISWLINREQSVKILDEILASMTLAELTDPDDNVLLQRRRELESVGFVTILDVKSQLIRKTPKIISAFDLRSKSIEHTALPRGISLHYLVHVMIAESMNANKAASRMKDLGFGSYSSQVKWVQELISLLQDRNNDPIGGSYGS